MAIQVFKNTDAGAPVLSGQNGALITVLDAVLVNGYNSVSVSGIARSGATATLTSAAHGLSTGDTATVAGAVETEYNGDFVVTVVSPTVLTYTITGTPTTPATGTITIKRASAGFSKTYSGTNKAVYRSDDLSSNRLYLRIVDNGSTAGGAKEASAWGYETMSDVDTGTGVFPTALQNAEGYYWRKSSTADSTARPWVIVTDGKLFYFFMEYAGTAATGMANSGTYYNAAFGDILSYKAGDAYSTIITGCTTANSSTSPPHGLSVQSTSITSTTSFASSITVARDFTAVAGPRFVALMATGFAGTYGVNTYLNYPHLLDNGYYLTPTAIVQATPTVIRGRMPGMYEGMHGRALNNLDIMENIQGLTGRKLMMIYTNSSSQGGHMMLDITGPWDS